jgi:predicted negative regulator of RcsB-dependent stress response
VAYQTEEEQVEALKKWWKENGKSVLGGALIGIAILYGGKVWWDQQDRKIEMASVEYEAMMREMTQDDKTKALEIGELILGQYPDSPYADLAALAIAKVKVEADDLAAAKTQLHWALDNTDKQEIKHIARLRLARVLVAEDKYDDALQLMESVKPDEFAAAYAELKGDIYVAKGQTEQAATAYNTALQELEPGSRLRQYIEMKLNDLGQAQAVAEAS